MLLVAHPANSPITCKAQIVVQGHKGLCEAYLRVDALDHLPITFIPRKVENLRFFLRQSWLASI